jgi:exopolysaccharide biosynthesis polyprenyl glycosylphosphotransferase
MPKIWNSLLLGRLQPEPEGVAFPTSSANICKKEFNMRSAQLKKSAWDVQAIPLSAGKAPQRARGRFEAFIGILERIADLAAVSTAALVAHYSYELSGIGKHLQYPPKVIVGTSLALAVLFVLMLDHAGVYQEGNSLLRIRETERILRVSVQAFTLMFLVAFFFGYPFSRWVVALGILFVPLLLIVEKQLIFLIIRHLHRYGYGLQNVLIYGAGYTGRRVFSALVRSPKVGLNPVAIVDDDVQLAGQTVYESGYKRERSAQVVAGPPTRQIIRDYGASMVVIAIPSLVHELLDYVATEAFAAQARVAFVPRLSHSSGSMDRYVDIDGVLIASLNPMPTKFVYEAAKRMFDLVAALALMIITAPLWAAIAVQIRRESAGPAFFLQDRVGHNGRHFRLYKFRSMRVDAPKYAFHPTGAYDPRVTRVGRWLRRTSLDELPQLLNVLKGDMSLVGPRPEMPFIVQQYSDQQRQRLRVKPGITGLWQLSADRAFLIHENIQYDLYYIHNRNLFMDLAILLHTLVFAMKGV